MNKLIQPCGEKDEFQSIIHIDRLSITFKHNCFSSFKNIRNPDSIVEKQNYGDIELLLDNNIGSNAYYHAFRVYYQGHIVGKLHTASKRGKSDIEFNFEKSVLYSNAKDWWYDVYQAVKRELKITYSNLKYIEICIDSTKPFTDEYGYLYSNSTHNKYRRNDFFKPVRNVKPEILDGGNGFRISGNNNRIQIYQKSNYAEDFILSFFKANGFGEEPVYRVESRLSWNYLRSLINKKFYVITPETILDEKLLATLFEISVRNKLSFYDLRNRRYDQHRNYKPIKVSIIDDLNISKSNLLKFEPIKQVNHYKANTSDEEIIRRIYYQFIATGNKKYFKNIRYIAIAAHWSDSMLFSSILKFNQRYKGDRSIEILDRMEQVTRKYSYGKHDNFFSKFLNRLGIKW